MLFRFAGLCCFLAVSFGAVKAQPSAASLVQWTASMEKSSVETSGAQEVTLALEARIEPGWRVYAMTSPVGRPLEIDLHALPDGVTLSGGAHQMNVRKGYDTVFESDYTYFTESARVHIPLLVRQASRTGVRGTVRFTVCNDRICLPPAEASFRTDLSSD